MNGKGSHPRPLSVSIREFWRRFEAVYPTRAQIIARLHGGVTPDAPTSAPRPPRGGSGVREPAERRG